MKFGLNKDKTGYILRQGDNEQNVIIPETYKGKPVTSISCYAFNDCISLKSVRIPDSVTRIGRGVFDCAVILRA